MMTQRLQAQPSNRDIADQLDLISTYYRNQRDQFRATSYSEAARAIANSPKLITSGTQARRELKGIGVSIASDIDEFIKTGKISRLITLESQTPVEEKRTIDLFKSIYGIGPITAKKYYDMGFRTIEDLYDRAPLTEAQRLGIIYSKQIQVRIPRNEMDIINAILGQIFSQYDPTLEWMIAGSYRRGESSSGDIDVLIKQNPGVSLPDIVSLLKQVEIEGSNQPGVLVGDLASGPQKYLGIFRLSPEYNAHRIDILMLPDYEWPYAVLYFTGSQQFNILMRQRAIDLGLTVNEHEMKNAKGELYPAETEEDVFQYLGLKYLPPEERTRNLQRLPLAPV